MKALRIIGREAEIFVEIKTCGVREIECGRFVQRDELFIHTERRAAGSEPENDFGVGAEGIGDDARGLLADLLAGFLDNHEHERVLPQGAEAQVYPSCGAAEAVPSQEAIKSVEKKQTRRALNGSAE